MCNGRMNLPVLGSTFSAFLSWSSSVFREKVVGVIMVRVVSRKELGVPGEKSRLGGRSGVWFMPLLILLAVWFMLLLLLFMLPLPRRLALVLLS